MDFYLAVYSSITLANRVKSYVSKDGEYLAVIHTPRSISNGGCSYSLRFKKHKLSTIKQASELLGVKIKGVYKETSEKGVKKYSSV